MLIIYRKSDGVVLDNQGIFIGNPLGVEDTSSLEQSILDNYGGTKEDYEVLRLHDLENAEIVNKTFTHEYTIQNGEIVFGELKPIPEPEPQLPTETELLTDYIIDVDYRVTMIELGL